MKSGNFSFRPVETGVFKLDGGAMFGVVPKVLWSETNPADQNNRIDMAMRALLIETGDHRILIDSGAGDKLGEKMVRNYVIKSERLTSVLEREGIAPESITEVVISHLHFDHAGGFTCRRSDRDYNLSCPGAIHFVQKSQWEAAVDPNEKDRASFFEENFLPIREQGKLRLLEGRKEIIPGVTVIPTQGHTPGHQVTLVDTGELRLLYCADLIPLVSHINLPYIMAYDHFPLSTLREKKNLLGRAAAEKWILFFEHDPEIDACTVRKNQKGRFEVDEVVDIG